MCADIVIVGGGPIGCWTAIQAKKRNPGLNIKIYERHPEYQRDHMMSIRRESLTRYSKRTGDAAEKEFYGKIAAAPYHGQIKGPIGLDDVTTIRTLDFEKILKEHCGELGIDFAYEAIDSPEDVMTRHPECKMFVAADGARSKMRTALLGENSVHERTLLHSVDVKYKAKGQAKRLSEQTFDKIDMIVVETIGREKDGATDVALRFLVDEEEFNHIPEATFKNPLTLQTVDGRGRSLAGAFFMNSFGRRPFSQEVQRFQHIRAQYAGEEKIEGSEVITKIKLSQYASKKFAVTVDHDTRRAGWFMVGDAAMGMPFYRSINSGLMQGSQLGALLASERVPLTLKTGAYNTLRPVKLAREFGAVSAKLSGIRLYKNVARPALRGFAIAGVAALAIPAATIAIPAAPILWGLGKLGIVDLRLM